MKSDGVVQVISVIVVSLLAKSFGCLECIYVSFSLVFIMPASGIRRNKGIRFSVNLYVRPSVNICLHHSMDLTVQVCISEPLEIRQNLVQI